MSSSFDTQAALKHFSLIDPTMAALLKASLTAPPGDCLELPTAKPPAAYFENIVRSIIGQQISTKAADAVFGRVVAAAGGATTRRHTVPTLTPEGICSLPEDTLRTCGLSGQKTRYIRHNASVWHTLNTSNYATLSDEAVICELTTLSGIGRWTAEMFLMFTLARPDVFSFGDLGLTQSLYQHYPHRPHHIRKIKAQVESWSPHRTLASLSLWWHRDNSSAIL